MKKLKSLLKFWQEIVFIVVLGRSVLLITIDISEAFQHFFNIVFFCIFILMLICILGQFFWKNPTLALWLALLLGAGSIWMTIASLSNLLRMSTEDDNYLYTIFASFLFMGLIAVAISMPFKYFKKNNVQSTNKV